MNKNTKVIVVTSGKGGVGKTTSSAAIAAGLALAGKKTCVIDFDIGLRNLDLIMGVENRVYYDFIQVMNGEGKLNQALIKYKTIQNLYMLAASQTKNKDALTTEGVRKVLDQLIKKEFDYIICDSPAGIEAGARHALYWADEAIVVTNAEVSSVRDSDRMLGLLDSETHRAINDMEPVKQNLLITRYNPKRVNEGEMLSLEDIINLLGDIKQIGVIPESRSVMTASNKGQPVITIESEAAEAYKDVVQRILGNDLPMRFTTVEEKSFLKRIFGG